MLKKVKQLNFKKLLPYGIGLAVFALVFVVFPHQTKALDAITNGLGSLVVSLLSWIFQAFTYVTGTLLIKAIEILIKVLTYNDFLNAPIVVKGWTVLRDTCNIAITIVMLLMSFYAVFRNKSYQYQSFLPKLVVAAIAINFSKVIAGFMIDISQVFMMTFVNAFKDAAAGNLTYGFGIEDMLRFGDTAGRGFGSGSVDLSGSINNWSIFGGLVLASLMVLIALVVVISLVVMMMYRILALWFLIMASPIAFIGGLLPGKQEDAFSKQWWDNISKFLVQGPVVAFMLWLSFAVISEMTESKHIMYLQFESQVTAGNVTASDVGWQAFASKISGTQNIMDYLVTCGLLIMTLIAASKTGIAGSKIAGNFMNKLEGAGKWIQNRPEAWGRAGVKRFGTSKLAQSAVALGTRYGRESGVAKFVGLNKEFNQQKAEERKAWAQQNFGGRISAIRSQEKKAATARAEALKKVGMGDWTDEQLQQEFEKNRQGMLSGPLAVDKKATAQAMILELANRKKLTKDIMGKYQNDFGFNKEGENLLDTTDGKNAAIFEIDAWKAQEKAGDAFADFKKSVKYNSDRNAYETYNAEDDIKDSLNKEVSEIKGNITSKTITGKLDENDVPTNPLELSYVRGLMEHHTQDIFKFDKTKRGHVAAGIKNMLANRDAWGISDEEAEKLKNFHQILTAKESSINSRGGWFKDKEPKKIDKFGDLDDWEKNNLGARLTDDDLEKTRRELKGKTISALRGVAESGSEKFTNLDLAAAREIYGRDKDSKTGMKDFIKAINGVKEEIRQGNNTDKIQQALTSAVNSLSGQIRNNAQTTQINPTTGTPYTEREVFERSRLGRTIDFVNKSLEAVKNSGVPITDKQNEKSRKAIDHAMSFITAHTNGLMGQRKNTLRETNDVRRDAQFFANKIDEFLGGLSFETDNKKRAALIANAHKQVRNMVKENENNQDENYLRNMRSLADRIERALKDNSVLNEKYIKDLQDSTRQIRNYNF